MTHFKLSLLASAAIGIASISGASAAPAGNVPAVGENAAQHVRVVCDRYGRCYNTRNLGARHYRNNGYQGYNSGYYSNRRSYGHGPFGIFSF